MNIMFSVLVVGLILPAVFATSNEGNIHLLEEEIAEALRICSNDDRSQRHKRSDEPSLHTKAYHATKIDRTSQDTNIYGHERRDTNDTREVVHVLNATDYDYQGYGSGSVGEKLVTDLPKAMGNRTKRHNILGNKPVNDQCISQCVFANLQVVDSRGIPREPELWSRVQSSMTSQQSRVALRDQLRACFQELDSEAEDDGCSYSNKLERCLMLQIDDRKPRSEDPARNV